MLQNNQDNPTNLIDLLTEAAQIVIESSDENGRAKKEIIPDTESLWMQTKMVNSPTFARYILKLRNLYDLAENAKDNMCAERAETIKAQILAQYKSHKYSIDSKSSETLRDAHNSQSSLNHILLRQHQERSITVKDLAKSGLSDAILGKKKQEATQD